MDAAQITRIGINNIKHCYLNVITLSKPTFTQIIQINRAGIQMSNKVVVDQI